MAGEQIRHLAVAVVRRAPQRIDKEQMRRAPRRFVKRHGRGADLFQRPRQADRIAGVLAAVASARYSLWRDTAIASSRAISGEKAIKSSSGINTSGFFRLRCRPVRAL